MKAILSKHLVVLFLVAAAFLTASAVICYHSVGILHRNQNLVTHTHRVLEQLQTARGFLAAAEASQRNHLFTGHADYLAAFQSAARRAADTADRLTRLTADNPTQNARAVQLCTAVDDRVALLEDGLARFRAGGTEAARDLILAGTGRAAMDRALTLIEQMDAEEDRLLAARSAQSSAGLRRLAVTFALLGLTSVFLLASIVFSVRREVAERAEAARQLKASEGRLLLAVEAAEIGIWEHDLVAGRVTVSQRGRDMFAIPPDEPTTGEAFLARLHPDDGEHLQALIRKAIEPGGRGEYVVELRVLHPDGTTRNVRSRGRALFDGAGPTRRAVRLVGTLLDLTDVRQVERDLRTARDQAEAASRAKDQFLAVLSHELRTPLTPVLASVSELEQRPDLPAPIRADIGTIRRNIEMEARLIDDLLDLTRIARGTIRLHPEIVDAHDLIPAVLDLFRADIADKRLRVTTDLAATHHHLWADPGRLQQVLWNLLSNSVKFTPRGGTIAIRTENAPTAPPADPGGSMSGPAPALLLSISDTGIGIDSAAIPRLFNAFEQGEQTLARKYGGLGLGLSISKAIVDLHDGSLTAQSLGRDRGATFLLRLKTVRAPQPTPAEPAAPAPAADAPPPAKLRILLVEDNEDTRRLMGRILRSFGHHVDAADSVSAALDLAARDRFDLLVSDIGLPDGTGWDLMARLADRRPPKAIAVSGFGMEDDLRRSREAGFLEHLTKPVNLTELRATIQRIAALPTAA